MGGHDNIGGFAGSSYIRGMNNNQFNDSKDDENWDNDQYSDDDVAALYKGKQHEGHKNNFYRCIAEGGQPVSDVFTHVQAMSTCHLSAIAARLGRVIKWDPKAEKIIGDEQAAAFVARAPRKGFEIPRV